MLSCHLCLLISCHYLVFWILSFDCFPCLITWYSTYFTFYRNGYITYSLKHTLISLHHPIVNLNNHLINEKLFSYCMAAQYRSTYFYLTRPFFLLDVLGLFLNYKRSIYTIISTRNTHIGISNNFKILQLYLKLNVFWISLVLLNSFIAIKDLRPRHSLKLEEQFLSL